MPCSRGLDGLHDLFGSLLPGACFRKLDCLRAFPPLSPSLTWSSLALSCVGSKDTRSFDLFFGTLARTGLRTTRPDSIVQGQHYVDLEVLELFFRRLDVDIPSSSSAAGPPDSRPTLFGLRRFANSGVMESATFESHVVELDVQSVRG